MTHPLSHADWFRNSPLTGARSVGTFAAMPTADTIPCPHCKGKGRVVDPKLHGARLRTAREKKGISLRDMAKELKISPAYLSDMELGRRAFSAAMVKTFEGHLKTLKRNRPTKTTKRAEAID